MTYKAEVLFHDSEKADECWMQFVKWDKEGGTVTVRTYKFDDKHYEIDLDSLAEAFAAFGEVVDE